MNPRVTLALAGLALVVAGLVWWLDPGEGVRRGSPEALLADVLTADVRAVRVRPDPRDDGQVEPAYRVELTEAGELFIAPLARPERREPAREEALRDLLIAARDLVPLRVLETEPDRVALAQRGLGPEQGASLVFELAGGETRVLRFGSPVGVGGRVARREPDGPLLVVDRRAAQLLLPGASALRDPRFLRVPHGSVVGLRLREGSRRHLVLDRSFDTWFLRHPFEALADTATADRLRNTLLALVGVDRLPGGSPTAFPPGVTAGWSVELRRSGDERPLRVHFGRTQAGRPCGRIEGALDTFLLDRDPTADLARPPGHYRSRRVAPVASELIARIELRDRGAGRPDLVFERGTGRNLLLRVPTVEGARRLRLPCDPIEAETLLEAVAELRLDGSSFDPEGELAAEDERGRLLVIAAPAEDGGDPVRVAVRFGAPDALRAVPVAIEGEPGVGRMPAEEAAFLAAPWWSRLGRQVVVTDAWFRFHRFELTGRSGRPHRIQVSIPEAETGTEGALVTDSGTRVMPAPIYKALERSVMGGLEVLAWEPAAADPASRGFDRPWLTLRWFDADDATAESGVPVPAGGAEVPGRWGRLLIGAESGGGTRWLRLEGPYTVEGRIAEDRLGALLRGLEWIEG